MSAWYETFFDGLYGQVLADSSRDEGAAEQARLVKRLLEARKGQRVLDVPCGEGRLTIPLARMGLEMTGVDFTQRYLRRGRRLARQEGLEVRWVHGDMRDVDFTDEFHGAFNWFGSFGYFSDADNLRVCQRVLAALRPGGRFLIEGINKSWLLTHLRRTDDSLHGKVRIVTRNRWDPRTHRIHSTWTLSKGNRTERHKIVMRIFNGGDIRTLLRAAGFRDVRLSTRPHGRFTRHSRRLIAVGRKPRGRG